MSTSRSNIARQIEVEHENLKLQMAQLQKAFQTTLSPNNFQEWKISAVLQLRDFKGTLEKHFEMEEIGGFNEELVRLNPHNQKKIEELEIEHREILLKLEQIIQQLKEQAAYEEAAVESLVKDLINVIETLHAHEASERELVNNTYFQDVGSAD